MKSIGRRKGGLPLGARIGAAAALFLSAMMVLRSVIEFEGFPPLRYQGLRARARARVYSDLLLSAESKRSRIESWFKERELNASSIAIVIAGLSETAGLLEAPLRGWDAEGRNASEVIGRRLHAYLGLNPAYKGIFLAERVSGRLVAASSGSVDGRARDLSWAKGSIDMRVATDGGWELAALARAASGLEYALVVDIDPSGFFADLAADPVDLALGLDSAVIGLDGYVLLSGVRSRFPVGVLALPLYDLRRLEGSSQGPVSDHAGVRLLARLTEVEPIPGMHIRLLVALDASSMEGPLIRDHLTTIAFEGVFLLAGLALTVGMVRRTFRPLLRLESAVIDFKPGAPLPDLPRDAPGEVGLIASSVGDLMRKVSDWRRDLEREVEARTMELQARSAIAWCFANDVDDDTAYGKALSIVCAASRAGGGAFAYWDGARSCRLVVEGENALRTLDREEARALVAAAGDPSLPFPIRGIGFPHRLVRRLESAGQECGYVFLFREYRAFDEEESKILGRILEEVSPLVLARLDRAREEHIRKEAERALRRSEERLRTFFADSRDMIYTANADDVIASMNDAGLRLLGKKDRFEVVGHRFMNFALSPEDRILFVKKIGEQGFVADYEIVLTRSEGPPVFCLETAQAIKDREGNIVEVQGIVKDITDRINTERELWKTNLELAEAIDKVKSTQMIMVQQEKLASIGQLAAGIAHEINNPLGFLKSNHGVLTEFIETLRKAWEEAVTLDAEKHEEIARRFDLGFVFSEVASLVTESDEGYGRIMDIVKNLKSFARSDLGGGFSSYDLNKGIESSLVVARNEIKYVAEVELELGALPPIDAAGGEINQVLLNILVNSAQAIAAQKRAGLGRIRVSTFREGGFAVCAIADDGPGVPENLRLSIFDPFFTTKEPGKGTGLGLSISYDIVVAKHGGRLSVDTSPIGGALFRIELPVSRHPEAPA